MSDPALDALADRLDASPDYHVLRRFDAPRTYATPTGGEHLRTAAALDVETTGMDRRADAIIQLSMVPFTYDAESGRIFEVGATLNFFEDPGRPIPPEIVALTGITDAQVAGQRIDEDAVRRFLEPVSLMIAHNADFDRPFMERRMPEFRDKAWACSVRDVDWRGHGLSSSSLEYLLMKRCRRFYGAHRADQDAEAVVHLLATPFDDGTLPMALLLANARRGTVRIWAEGAPIETKDLLKSRRYRWNPGTDGRPKAWYRELDAEQQDAELEWLFANVFGGERRRLRIDAMDARVRYSERG
ncbi:MAG TPA: 3'-5' exonuclease [Gemmatimonadaceae bacterium]|nr:3'-5' exonuclease [Gemmatimonadaceae bacterium]